MKSILIISQHIFPKQTPRAHRTTELAIEFSKQGYDVTVYAVLGSYNYNTFAKRHNINIKPIKITWQYEPFSSDLKVKRFFIIRTSWLYSKRYGKNFYKTICGL